MLKAELQDIIDAGELDDRRLREYFERIPGDDDTHDWKRRLLYRNPETRDTRSHP